jgi:hypothetical protein
MSVRLMVPGLSMVTPMIVPVTYWYCLFLPILGGKLLHEPVRAEGRRGVARGFMEARVGGASDPSRSRGYALQKLCAPTPLHRGGIREAPACSLTRPLAAACVPGIGFARAVSPVGPSPFARRFAPGRCSHSSRAGPPTPAPSSSRVGRPRFPPALALAWHAFSTTKNLPDSASSFL